MKKLCLVIYLLVISIALQAQTLTVCEKEVEICGKIWMGCNLNVDTYRNGDPIPEVKDPKDWADLKTGAWCYYNNDPANGEIYGKLYNWYAVNDPRGLAPEGWHVASDAEWTELTNCLHGAGIAGGKLKEAGTVHWNSPNTGATNETGFSALPGGCRYGNNGAFGDFGFYGNWWSSTESGATGAWLRHLLFNNANLNRNFYNKAYGFSVRCVRD